MEVLRNTTLDGLKGQLGFVRPFIASGSAISVSVCRLDTIHVYGYNLSLPGYLLLVKMFLSRNLIVFES